MSKFDIIRAWKDADYRESLTPEEQSQIPENPAGLMELDDVELAMVEGGGPTNAITSLGCCPILTYGCVSVGCPFTYRCSPY